MNHKTIPVGLIICSLFVMALITHSRDLTLMILPFLVYLGIGIFTSPVVDRIKVTAQRHISKTQTADDAVVEVEITLQNLGKETVTVHLKDTLQSGMKFLDGDLERYMILRQGEKSSMEYTFRALRGSFAWDKLKVMVGDPLGLIETGCKLPAEGDIQIKPRMRRFKPIQMRPNSTLHSPGSIPARLGGSGTDFWGVREYHPGDPLRRLDWRQTARHPYQFFTKEFEQEEIAEIGLILDGRRKVELRLGEDSLFERSLGATSSLAEMFLHQGHRVSLLVYGETMLQAFPGYGKIQLHRIMDCLARVRVGSESGSLDTLEYLPIRMFPSQALIVIISALSSNDWSLFPRLRAMGYQVLLISPDAIDFAAKTMPDDRINRLAIQAARIERHLKLRNIAQLQISVIDWKVDKPLPPLLRYALSRPRGQRR
jgi:uncharacterized protein (DUF58 family)